MSRQRGPISISRRREIDRRTEEFAVAAEAVLTDPEPASKPVEKPSSLARLVAEHEERRIAAIAAALAKAEAANTEAPETEKQ